MTILIKVLAGVGALSVLGFVIIALVVSYVAWKENKEQELKEFVDHVIRYNPYLSSKLDTLELKQIGQDVLEERYTALEKRESELWSNNGKQLHAIMERFENQMVAQGITIDRLKKEIEKLKAPLV